MKHLFLLTTLLLPFCLSAQLSESFANPDITSRYPWQGDTAKYIPDAGFLRLNDMGRNSEALVYLYGATLAENEWNFRVRSDYMVTGSNFQRVYLWSDKTDLNTHHNAYYLELGKSKKKIALMKTTGLQRVDTLISSVVNNFNDAHDLHIRIVSDANNTISLYARSDQKTDYTYMGKTSYSPQQSPGYFILYCRYSQDHSKDKYFGPVEIKNFTILNEVPAKPTEELALLSLNQEDASTLELIFNQQVDPGYASFKLGALGEAVEVYLSEDEKQVKLVWSGKMENGKTYSLSYTGLNDSKGYTFNGTTQPFLANYTETIVNPVTYQYAEGDVLINEVMADPKGVAGLPETEYVELYNKTGKEIDLTGWLFVYDAKETVLKSVIPANGYAVLYRNGRDITIGQQGTGIPLAAFPSALANTGKYISLKSPSGALIDEYTYPKAKSGYSWERTTDGWQNSLDERGGTPGSENSSVKNETGPGENPGVSAVMPREIIFSELLPEPQAGGSEYVELYNRSGRTLPLKGLAVATRKSDGTLNTAYELAIAADIEAGEYAVLTKSIDGVRDFFLVSSPGNLYELKLPTLANTSSQLVLFRISDEEVIDEVHYSEKWHSSSVKDKKGVALERIDPDMDSQDRNNWTSASALSGGGTPGDKNSQSPGENEDGAPTGINSPEYSPATGNYAIAYNLDRSGYLCRAYVYDTSGRRIAEIANHELLGTVGNLSWDGLITGGNKPPTGVYIFHAELYHPQGGSKTYKKVFLVK